MDCNRSLFLIPQEKNDYFLNLEVSSLGDGRFFFFLSQAELCKFHRDKEQIGISLSFLEMQKSVQGLFKGVTGYCFLTPKRQSS